MDRSPARQFTKPDGSVSYSPLIEFVSDEDRRRFQIAALGALDRCAEVGR